MSITVIVNEDEKITTKEENLLQDSEKYEEALPEIINAKEVLRLKEIAGIREDNFAIGCK